MANTYSSLYYHLIFSTKNRIHWIHPEIQHRVWAYIGGIARRHKMTALEIGGFTDHVHSLICAPAPVSPSMIAQHLKGDSSKWVHGEFPSLRNCGWQDGFGAYTVSKSDIPEVIRYIQNQTEHHRRKSFQEEYLEFLRKHGIEYDERYLWG
jgi:putative transposase